MDNKDVEVNFSFQQKSSGKMVECTRYIPLCEKDGWRGMFFDFIANEIRNGEVKGEITGHSGNIKWETPVPRQVKVRYTISASGLSLFANDDREFERVISLVPNKEQGDLFNVISKKIVDGETVGVTRDCCLNIRWKAVSYD